MNKIEQQRKTGILFVALIAILAMCIESAHAQPKWDESRIIDIYVHRDGPLSLYDTYYSAMYAGWAWGQRTGLRTQVRGSSSQAGDNTRGIVIEFGSSDQMKRMKAPEGAVAATWVEFNLWTDDINFAYILIDESKIVDFAHCFGNILIHEMGHAVGIQGHSDDAADVMHADYDTGDCRHMITANDARMAPYEPQLCHSELSPVGDLYIPSIQGTSATLSYRGGMRWQLDQAREAVGGCSGIIAGDSVRLYDVRTFDAWLAGEQGQRRAYNVTLRVDGESVELINGEVVQ